ncbi:MAG: hypothetical protein KC912_22640 [Proteobacteria bacterium]|nr:hypothetical protein [Pseudomonadota bacterium]
MEKGQRVNILKGRNGKGESGTIFWKGPNKWGEGERLGVRSDGGETFWVSDQDVEVASGSAPPQEAGPTFSKGDRVSFKDRGREGTGMVFWIGQSRHGPGQRLGVRDDAPEGSDDAVWIEATQARALEGEAPAPRSAPHRGGGGGYSGGGGYDDAIPPAQSYEMPPMDDGPPLDDAYADQMAAAADDVEEPPHDL